MKPNMRATLTHEPWNKDKLVRQEAPLKFKDIWVIRLPFQRSNDIHNLVFSISRLTAGYGRVT